MIEKWRRAAMGGFVSLNGSGVRWPDRGKNLLKAAAAAIGAKRPRAAFFGYSWQADGNPDGYMSETIEGIRKYGIDVDLFMGNHFTAKHGLKGIASNISLSRLSDYIRSRDYSFAVSFNNSMLTVSVVEVLDCRPVSIIVDSEHHLFDHAERGGFSAFDLDVVIAPIYTSLREAIAGQYPNALDRFHFLPPATGYRPDSKRVIAQAFPYNISWIASLVADIDLDRFAHHMAHSKADATTALACLDRIRSTGYLGEKRDDPGVRELAKQIGWDIDKLERQLQNIVTNDERIGTVNMLSSRGLRLYGNDPWSHLLPYNLAVADSLALGEKVSTHAELMSVYNASKISINVPQAQALTGMQYRILDIMASRSLLLTKYVADSDMLKIFGDDFPVPRFKDLADLGRLADHFLGNEAERQQIVAQCNALVSKGFSFVERAADYLKLSNPAVAAALPSHASAQSAPKRARGELRRVDLRNVINWTGMR